MAGIGVIDGGEGHRLIGASSVVGFPRPTDSCGSAPQPTLAPPGWYMLFLVDGAGVPSIASCIQLMP